jgi:REP element-mobilizing transposase RayT
MRHWLLTSTTYGTWLPGDERGFVGRVWDARPDDPATDALRLQHDQKDQPYDQDIPGLKRESQRLMKGPPIFLNAEQAEAVLAQFKETATFRGWTLHAASVMANHFHAIIEAMDDVMSDDILGDLKSYASRRLNKACGKPQSGTWWTASGSKRPLREPDRLFVPIRYVLNQHRFLTRYLNLMHGTIEDFLGAHGGAHGGLTPTAQEDS